VGMSGLVETFNLLICIVLTRRKLHREKTVRMTTFEIGGCGSFSRSS